MKIFIHLHSMFHSLISRVKINSTNWPAPNVSANAEAMGSNPVEAPNFFFFFCGGWGGGGLICNCLIAITTGTITSSLKIVFPRFTSSSF